MGPHADHGGGSCRRTHPRGKETSMLTKWMWAICVAVMGVALVSGAALAADTKTDAKVDVKVDAKATGTAPAAKVEAKTETKEAVKLNKAA